MYLKLENSASFLSKQFNVALYSRPRSPNDKPINSGTPSLNGAGFLVFEQNASDLRLGAYEGIFTFNQQAIGQPVAFTVVAPPPTATPIPLPTATPRPVYFPPTATPRPIFTTQPPVFTTIAPATPTKTTAPPTTTLAPTPTVAPKTTAPAPTPKPTESGPTPVPTPIEGGSLPGSAS